MKLLTKQEIEKLLDGTTPGPWFMQDFTAPEVNDDPTASDVYVSCTWPDHICVASMGGGLQGHRALEQARADAAAIATWPTLAHTTLALMARLEDAEAAQALVVERAAAICQENADKARKQGRGDFIAHETDAENIRALADPSGVAALAALRAERRMIVSHATMGGTDGEGLSVNEISVRITELRNSLYKKATAERDDALTRLAAAEAQVVALREALAWYGEQARLARLIHSEGDAGRHALQADGGKRARTALASADGGAK